MLPPSLLHGQHLRLTAVSNDDISTMIRWYEDDTFLRLLDAAPSYPKSPEQLSRWLDTQQKTKDTYLFGIRLYDPDELIGLLALEDIFWVHGVSWLSIGIGQRNNRGKGYGCEAMQLGLAFAFHELNLHRVQLTVFSYNERAIALYEKLGFQREGVYREFMQRDGQRHDMYLYGLLRREWEALRKSGGVP